MSKIPTQIMDYKVYKPTTKTGRTGNKETLEELLGTGEEMELPTIVNKTYTAALAGGDVDLPSLKTENIEQEIPYNALDEDALDGVNLTTPTTIIVRAAKQKVNTSTHALSYSGYKITYKGFLKELKVGTLKSSGGMDSSIKLTVTYLKIESITDSSTVTLLEIDKLNGTYKINGADVRSGYSQYL